MLGVSGWSKSVALMLTYIANKLDFNSCVIWKGFANPVTNTFIIYVIATVVTVYVLVSNYL